MAIVRNDQADAFVRRTPDRAVFFLVHGTDEGLIHERASALVKKFGSEPSSDALNVLRVDGDALARDPSRLADEAYAISLFGGRRAIWIDARGRDLAPMIAPLLERPPEDCLLVVEAGNLKKGTALRSLFEKSDLAASIECYPDERRTLMGMIETETREAGVDISSEAKQYLASLLGSDRMTSRGEISKLLLYARGRTQIEVTDVEAIVSEAAPSSLDAVIDCALLGNLADAEVAAARFFDDGGDSQFLMARLIARVSLLYLIRLEIEQGRTFDHAMQGQFVRLSPAGRAALQKQSEKWTSRSLSRRLPSLLGVAARSRREGRLDAELVTRALWAMASGARAGSRRA